MPRHWRAEATPSFGRLERFQAKWKPVRVKKTRQIKNLEPRFDSIETEKARGPAMTARVLLLLVRRGFFAARLGQAADDVSRQIPRQNLRLIGLVAAFQPLHQPGAALFRCQRACLDGPHGYRRTIGFEPQFIRLAILVGRAAGDAGNPRRRKTADLLAHSSRQFGRWHWQGLDFSSVLLNLQ